MHRLLVFVLLALVMAGCSSHRVQESVAPDFSYAFVVDGKVVKTLWAPALAERVSAVVQPTSGESAIWQNHGASYVHVVLTPRQQEVTPAGGSVLKLRGEILYYRDVKIAQVEGNEEVVRGKPIEQDEMERRTVTVDPESPVNVPLAEGLSVLITALPKQAPAPQP